MPLCHYPKVAVKGFADIVLRKPGYIYIGKSGETGKDEQVPDVFQPFGNHFLFEDDFYLVLRQVAPIHFLQPDFITGERVVYQYAVVTGYDNNTLEELHELGGGVVAALAGGTQVQLKIGNEHRAYLLNGYVRYIVLALNELGKLPNGKILPIISNQKLNAYLKEIADVCGIKKNLTFHLARHTFATTTTLSKGVPIETVSKMLGHTNIETTQIYARITNSKIGSDMQGLDKKFVGIEKIYKEVAM